MKIRSPFNTVSIYLLGYGDAGKTTLRQTLKNRHSTLAKIGLNREAKSLFHNERTRGVEIERGISISQYSTLVIDFGGQHHYHQSTHIFMRTSRSLFIILANPFEEGFEEQIRYWCRLLVHKKVHEFDIPEVLIVFSRRDDEVFLSFSSFHAFSCSTDLNFFISICLNQIQISTNLHQY